jgi:hypothetical protein
MGEFMSASNIWRQDTSLTEVQLNCSRLKWFETEERKTIDQARSIHCAGHRDGIERTFTSYIVRSRYILPDLAPAQKGDTIHVLFYCPGPATQKGCLTERLSYYVKRVGLASPDNSDTPGRSM